MIMDHYHDKWREYIPQRPAIPWEWPPTSPGPHAPKHPVVVPAPPQITPEEIAEFKKLLERAREYDRRNNEPDCEMEEKRRRVRDLAKELWVEIEFL
ncbi:MAG: hypothetical protein KGL39_10665 [Patescibacteria group bacterium]|nr:hypothetical protein [Patescibacteria group bacterium]